MLCSHLALSPRVTGPRLGRNGYLQKNQHWLFQKHSQCYQRAPGQRRGHRAERREYRAERRTQGPLCIGRSATGSLVRTRSLTVLACRWSRLLCWMWPLPRRGACPWEASSADVLTADFQPPFSFTSSLERHNLYARELPRLSHVQTVQVDKTRRRLQ